MKQHRTEQFPNFGTERRQLFVLNGSDVAAVQGEIDARIGFRILTIAVSQLGQLPSDL